MTQKSKTITEVMKELNKKHKEDSVIYGEEMEKSIQSIDTGCFSLNRVFGCNGLPAGRCIEILGENNSGKSSLAMFLIAQVQKNGGRALLIDVECAYSSEYAKKLGIDTDNLIVSQSSSGEKALEIVEKMVATNEFDIVVIDSVAALVPQKELDGDISDVTIALQAKMLSRHLRVVTNIASKTKTSIIYINQIRDNVMGWGNKIKTTGGRALSFYASVRLEVKALAKIKRGEDVIGNHLKIYAVKNKVGLPFKSCEIDLYFEKGIDIVADILDSGIIEGIIIKTGNTYSYNDSKLGVGRDNSKEFLDTRLDLVDLIKKDLENSISKIKPEDIKVEEVEDAEEE
jgi:recombination protein RecA